MKPRWRNLPPEIVEAIRQLAAEGLWTAEIGRRLDLAHHVVGRALRRNGIAVNRNPNPTRARRAAPRRKPARHLCEYHDCQVVLPSPGVCRPGIGNPCCVARGPRVTVGSSHAPWGWHVDDDYQATPKPECEPALARLVQLVESGLSVEAVARAMRWPPSTVKGRMAVAGRLYQQWLAVRAGERRVAA